MPPRPTAPALLLLLAASLLAASCERAPAAEAGAATPPAPITDKEARVLYDRACLSCHGPTGKGNGVRTGMLRTTPPDFTDGGWQRDRPDEVRREIILNGKGSMPPFKHRYNSAEIDGLLRVVRSFDPAAASPPASEAPR